MPGPATARFSPHAKYASAFQSYADAFVDSMRWDASWDLSQSRNIFGLFANVSGDSVGFVQEHFRLDPERYREQTPGLLVVLPNINDLEQRTSAIFHLLKYTVPLLRPGLLPKWTPPPEPPNSWFARYDPPILATKMQLHAQRRAQLEDDEQLLREERERLGHYKELIRSKDDRLHELVAEVFSDVFAFAVVNLDDTVPPGGARGADLMASKNNLSVLIEVKGATNTSLQQQHVFAFTNNIGRHVREYGPVSARLLVINSEGAKPPEERNAFSQEVVAYAAANDISVMSALSLFHLVERRLDGTLSDEYVQSLLIKPGLISE